MRMPTARRRPLMMPSTTNGRISTVPSRSNSRTRLKRLKRKSSRKARPPLRRKARRKLLLPLSLLTRRLLPRRNDSFFYLINIEYVCIWCVNMCTFFFWSSKKHIRYSKQNMQGRLFIYHISFWLKELQQN